MRGRLLLSVAACAAGTTAPASAGEPLLSAVLPLDETGVVLTAITAGAVVLAVAAGMWALVEQKRSLKLKRQLRNAGARQRAAVGERDALLDVSRDALIVWGRDTDGPLSYGGAEAQLNSCLKGPDATGLSLALDDLSARGSGFAMPARDAGGRNGLHQAPARVSREIDKEEGHADSECCSGCSLNVRHQKCRET